MEDDSTNLPTLSQQASVQVYKVLPNSDAESDRDEVEVCMNKTNV